MRSQRCRPKLLTAAPARQFRCRDHNGTGSPRRHISRTANVGMWHLTDDALGPSVCRLLGSERTSACAHVWCDSRGGMRPHCYVKYLETKCVPLASVDLQGVLPDVSHRSVAIRGSSAATWRSNHARFLGRVALLGERSCRRARMLRPSWSAPGVEGVNANGHRRRGVRRRGHMEQMVSAQRYRRDMRELKAS